ncbi:hypothetical protein NGRA_0541 [Nosema granulosis]|uniref:Uncharacterized protein n=1 Tax=Nosema granulosis TaxID=83296 RepID=A0A9P6H0N7_9MICR|nr:hypothetical protein NGRA_0541 [Nosema granulosis]
MKKIFFKSSGFYIPQDLSDNNFRHCGFKFNKNLFLGQHELLYLLYSNEDLDLSKLPIFVRAYFYLKKFGYNILIKDYEECSIEKCSTEKCSTEKCSIEKCITECSTEKCSIECSIECSTEKCSIEKCSIECSIECEYLIRKKVDVVEAPSSISPPTSSGANTIYKLFRRTKHFKRSDQPIGFLEFVNKSQIVSKILENEEEPLRMLCVLSQDEYLFLDIQKLENLNLETDSKLHKY